MSKTFEDRWEMLKNHFPDLCTEEFRRVAWNFYEYGKIDGGREELEAMRDATQKIFGSSE